jgi:aminoglycoside phosphotransferase (APT) family kinase protein
MTAPGLPELATLLDPALLRTRLAAITDARAALVGVMPFYLRWKPGTSALLGVRLKWQAADGFVETLASLYLGDGLAEAGDKAETLRLLEPEFGPALARLDGALFLAFPNDRLLKGLSAVADARRVCNRLGAPETSFTERGVRFKKRTSQVHPVRWKPGRRAVLELDLRIVERAGGPPVAWRAFARVMPAAELDTRLTRWLAAAHVRAVAAPEVVFVDTERSWFATVAVPGVALASAPASPALRAALHAAFSELHAAADAALSTRSDHDDLAGATRALEALTRVAPELAERAMDVHRRLGDMLSTLAVAPRVFTHGDLGADQLLVDRDHVSVIDWDEAANGDPHADWASLTADLRGRGIDNAWVALLAREVLADRYDSTRMGWQCAAAEARRVIEALQRGRADWRPRALDALTAAEQALAAVTPPAAPHAAVPEASPPDSNIGVWLAALADPSLRFTVPGLDADVSRVAAVWPDGEHGAIVRLERASEPGTVVRWLRLGAAVEVFDFPEDPALLSLGGLLGTGRFRAAGHRLGKRAALREATGDRFLFLRPEAAVQKAFGRVREAYRRLSEAGVPASRPLALADGLPGWWAEGMPGRALDPSHEDSQTWEMLGATLARAHATHTDTSAPAAGLAAAVLSGRKQLALVRLADVALADELDRDLSGVALGAPAGRPAWIHGDLHPLQVVVGSRLVILDWERARVGEAEEDLGNFLAHLAWEAFAAAPTAWGAFLRGYAQAGGRWDGTLLAAHACASLARVRAIHGWRDGSRERARETARWQAWREGIAR